MSIIPDVCSPFSTLQIGLTGSVGMGKSTISNQLKHLGFPVFDADHEVHKLYSVGGAAVEPIYKLLPDVVVDGAIHRPTLMEKIMTDPSVLQLVEQVVHPLVINSRQEFYQNAVNEGHFMVVYDIPLLFENRAKYEVDYTIVVTANSTVQKSRVLGRNGMTVEKFESILLKQMPDEEKRRLADFLIHTDYESYVEAKAQVATVLENIIAANEDKWARWKARKHKHASTLSTGLHLTPSSTTPAPFDMLLFDLDDTLAPTKKQLGLAYGAMSEYMGRHMPLTAQDLKDNHLEIYNKIKAEHPLIHHDLNELRMRAMQQVAAKYPGESQFVDGAMEAFTTARNDIERNLFEDVMDCFRWAVGKGIKIGILTNGSANLDKCAALRPFITLYFTAADLGAAKPSPVGFLAAAQRSGFVPSRILYIGDSYEHDVKGANNVGMRSALLLRDPVATTATATAGTSDTTDATSSAATTTSTTTTTGDSDSTTAVTTTVTVDTHLKQAASMITPAVVSTVPTDYSEADIVLTSLHPEELERKIDLFLLKRFM